MEIKKKITKIIIGLLITLASSVSIAADNFCDETLNGVLSESGIDFSAVIDNQEIRDCVKTKSLFSLPTKILYLIFGDVALDAMSAIITNTQTKEQILEYREELGESNSIINISVVFKAITVLMFSLASLVITYQSLFLLYNTSKEGNFLGKDTNTTWTILKMTMGVSLLLPIPELDGYSLAQILVIAAGVFASMLAGMLWIFISIVMNYLFITNYDQMTGRDMSDFRNESLNVVNGAISMEVCNIERKIMFLEKDASIGRTTETTHNKNEFSKCLKTKEAGNNNVIEGETFTIQPKEHKIVNACVQEIYKTNTPQACGVLVLNKTYNNTEDKEILLEEISNKAKNIASKMMNLECVNKDILDKYGKPYQYGYICAELINGGFSFGGDKSINYVNKDDDYESRKEDIQVDFESFMQYANNLGKTQKDREVSRIIRENASYGLHGLSNGWFAASHYLMDISNKYKEVQRFSREIWDGKLIKYDGDNNELLESLNIEQDTHSLKIYHSSTEDVLSAINGMDYTLGTIDKIEFIEEFGIITNSLQKKLFSGFYALNNFLGIQGNSITNELERDDNCFKNFDNCHTVVANPLFEYVKMGNDMLEISSHIIVTLAALEYVTDYVGNQEAPSGLFGGIAYVLNLLVALIKIYFVISLLIVYITPLIPFVYFLSYIISWILLIIEGVVTAQIWAFLHLMASKEEGLSKNVKGGYNLIFTIILKPLILIISMILSMVATSMAIGIFNILFGLILSVLPISENPSSMVSFAFNVFAYAIYGILLTIVILRVTKIIFEVPNKASEMLELTHVSGGNGQDWAEVMGRMTMITNTKLLKMFKI